jgi:fused signal recognition particle receptor
METTTEKNELIVIVDDSQLETATRETLLASFEPFLLQAKEWREKAQALIVTDATQLTEKKQAREGRLALKKIRNDADKTRKLLKEDSNRYGKAVQGIYNVIEALIVPIEEHLEKQEKFAEIAEANRKEALHNERVALLQPYGVEYAAYDLRNMSAEAFAQLLDGSRLAHENKLAEAARIEEEKIAALKAEQERIEAQRLENERLKKEAEAQQIQLAKEREQAESERKAIEEKSKKEREEAALLAKIEADKQAAILKAEREEREKVEAELKAKQQAEADQKAAEEKQRIADEKAAKKLASAPDKDKLAILVMQLEKLVYPDVTSDEAKQIVKDTQGLIAKVITHVKTKTTEL